MKVRKPKMPKMAKAPKQIKAKLPAGKGKVKKKVGFKLPA